ncbi:MAG: glycosyltransferase [Bacteroidales bacterium]|nr:glycosyltransferase [Bacteroidales bacterium]
MRQSLPPDRIVLWLSRVDFPEGTELPSNLDYAIAGGLQIEYVEEDLKPHKKYYYAIQKFPEDIIITIDDDAIYPCNLIEELYNTYKRFPDCVVATRVRKMEVSEDRSLLPYEKWVNTVGIINRPSYMLLPIGLGGVLYPPHCFHQEVLDRHAINDLCLRADDIWLKFMELVNHVRVVATRPIMAQPEYVKDSQKVSLWASNQMREGNDAQINAILQYCNAIAGDGYIENLLYENRNDTTVLDSHLNKDIPVRSIVKPKISVVLPICNVVDYIEECITSLIKQKFKDIEIICVDDGSTDDAADILQRIAAEDERVGVVWMSNHGAGVARNRGLELARGEYVFFCDPDDFCDVLMLDKLYYRAKSSQCDVVFCGRCIYDDKQKHVTGKMLLPMIGEVVCSAEISDRIFNTFGYVPWNKIIKRSLLMEHEIRFQDLPRNNDIYFSNAVLVASKTIGIVNEPLYIYRINRLGSLQTAIDITPDTNIQAFRATYAFMQKVGNATSYDVSFRRMVWVEAIVRLASFRFRDSAERYYHDLCDKWVEEFGLGRDLDKTLSAAYLPAARAVMNKTGYDGFVNADMARRQSRMPQSVNALLAAEKKKVADRNKWLENEKRKVADRNKWLENEKKKVADRDKLLAKKEREIVAINKEVHELKFSEAYRVGMFVTWPARRAYRMIKCYRENGLKYTLRRLVLGKSGEEKNESEI